MKTALTLDDIQRVVEKAAYHHFPETTTTVCCLTLKDGFTVIGMSACIDPASFDENLGRKIATDDAIEKVWQLEGYLLNYKIKRGIVQADLDAEPIEPAPAEPVVEQPVVEPISELVLTQADAEADLAGTARPDAPAA